MTSTIEKRPTTSARLSSFGLEEAATSALAASGVAASPAEPPSPADAPSNAPVVTLAERRGTGSETLHVLSNLEEVRAATETVAASGQRLLSIMTPDLEPELYDQPAFLDIIKRFVLGRSFAKVRVLLRDHGRMSSGGNRFVAMAHRLTSCLEIRIRAAQYRELTAAYCIADDRAIVYRLRADRAEGIAGFNNSAIARQYLQEFDAIWLASGEEPQVRVARR